MSEKSLLTTTKDWIQGIFKVEEREVRFEMEEVASKGVIPEEYAKRFEIIALQDASQLAGREIEMEAINQAYKNWAITANTFLIVGEGGCGMSSLINSSCVHFPHATVLNSNRPVRSHLELVKLIANALRIENATKLEDIQKIIESETYEVPPVIIIENVERLFRRKINGFNLLDDILLFIHATKEKIFWVVTINQYAAYYLNEVRNFAHNFPSELHIPPLTKEVIEELIKERNKGYEWFYLKPENTPKALERKLKNATPEEKQELLKANFYKNLHDFSEGNISIALLFVAGSVWHVKDKKVLIRPYNPKPIGDLEKKDLFLAEAILQHYTITPADLNAVMLDSGKRAALMLEILKERNLVKLISPIDSPAYFKIEILHLNRIKSELRNRLNRKVK